MLQRVKEVQESDLRMVGALARNIQRVIAVTQADIDAAAAQGRAWVVKPVVKVSDPLDNLRGGTQLVIKQNSILPGQNVMRVIYRGGQAVVVGPGSSPLALPNAVAEDVMSLIAYGGTEQRDVPVGYTQCDYVYFLANAYLTTDINPTYDGRYEFDFQTTTLGSSGATTYLGVRPTSSGNGGIRVARISSQVFRIYGFGAYKDSSATVTANTRYKFVWNNQRAVVTTGSTTVFDETYTGTEECNYPLTINGWNSAGSITPGAEGIFVYGFKAWNNQGVLVANYIPVKNANNEVGFYDTVSQNFKAQTSGTIAAGPNATPLPTAPLDIVCNNGALRVSPNYLDMSDENIVIGKYVDNSGVPTTSPANFYNSKYIPVVAGETYTWSTSSSIGYFSVMEYDSSKTFTKRTLFSNAGTSGSITLRSDTAYVLVGSNISGANVTLDMVQAINWQFERGSTASTFMPFGKVYTVGLQETINIHTKNLSPNELDNVGYSSTGSTSTSSTFCGNLHKIKCAPGDKFTVSCGNFPDGISGVFISTWKTDGTWNQRQAIAMISSYTYTIPAGVGEVNFTLYKTGGITIGDSSWLQVEKGNAATTYQPYFDGGSAVAEMLLSVGTSTDEQEVISGAVTRKVGVVVLDGTENVGTSNTTFTIAIADKVASKTPLICSHFQYSNKTSSQVEDLKVISFSSTNIGFRYDACANAAAFKTWLTDQYAARTPVIVVYQLATQTTESVAGQPLETTGGDNIAEITQASLDGLELEAEYTKTE